jgi:hypothetical protein
VVAPEVDAGVTDVRRAASLQANRAPSRIRHDFEEAFD